MKFARYERDGRIQYGILEGDGDVTRVSAPPWESYVPSASRTSLSNVRLLPPVAPSKIIAIGLNYGSHLGDRTPPSVPEPFIKTPSSLTAPGGEIVLPRDSRVVHAEAELAVVMGRRCKRASQDNALEFVAGYTCANDVSERGWQAGDLQWWRAKSSDTFTPLGPFIVTGIDPSDLALEGRVNGKVVQQSRTSDLIYGVPAIIEWVSSVMTLEPGDVILTGTPGQTAQIHAGDTVEVEVEGIGVLSNGVVSEDTA